MRHVLIGLVLVGFLGLALVDAAAGNYVVAAASALLGTANTLLFLVAA